MSFMNHELWITRIAEILSRGRAPFNTRPQITRTTMAWFSILPASISFIETWLIRLFLFLGFFAIGPWVLLLIYDLFLYFFRMATYDLPYIGGRARNRPRPRAPSLKERHNGQKRSIALPVQPTVVIDVVEGKVDGLMKRRENEADGNQRRNISMVTE